MPAMWIVKQFSSHRTIHLAALRNLGEYDTEVWCTYYFSETDNRKGAWPQYVVVVGFSGLDSETWGYFQICKAYCRFLMAPCFGDILNIYQPCQTWDTESISQVYPVTPIWVYHSFLTHQYIGVLSSNLSGCVNSLGCNFMLIELQRPVTAHCAIL